MELSALTAARTTRRRPGDAAGNLGPGDHFGKVALIDGGPRLATVTAATDLVCYRLTFWEFRRFTWTRTTRQVIPDRSDRRRVARLASFARLFFCITTALLDGRSLFLVPASKCLGERAVACLTLFQGQDSVVAAGIDDPDVEPRSIFEELRVALHVGVDRGKPYKE